IDTAAFVQCAGLGGAAELGETVAAAERPVATARARIVFQHLDLVAGLAQLEGRGQAGKSGAQNQNGCSFWVAVQPDRSLISRLRCEAEARHRMVHRGTSRHRPDEREQVAPADLSLGLFLDWLI